MNETKNKFVKLAPVCLLCTGLVYLIQFLFL